ncbi:hypothetical protein VTJ49DRAFT_6547 [Mycothermus thermophilus]|uniref:Pathway-specific nitrogen regulator n=1 Tax=Humicola insolens TaxID=85995 RepID=A0ABR3VIU6_HUMIN
MSSSLDEVGSVAESSTGDSVPAGCTTDKQPDTDVTENELVAEENSTADETSSDGPAHEPSASLDEPATDDAHREFPETDADADVSSSRPRSTLGDRKTSLRTEALIQATARAVIAEMEKRKSGDGIAEEDDDMEASLLSTDSHDTYTLGDNNNDAQRSSNSRQSTNLPIRHIPSRSTSSDDTGHEHDDDVFSDRSARSSVYSLDEHRPDDGDAHAKTPQASERYGVSRRDSYASSTGMSAMHPQAGDSPRVSSGFSGISGMSQYDREPFIPTSRDKRLPFRTPSEIQAMQMSSPTPSVFGGSSPRSAKRRSMGGSGTPAQYSPKGRSTPPRFKAGARREAPLVLLHVTLLPLRWVWGEVLNGLDAVMQVQVSGKAGGVELDEAGQVLFEPSEHLKGLRDAWRELQDRVGDTVLERGILIPHPQNDYEVLEERLLEALELPVKKRARILECGHYLGPANIMSYEEEEAELRDDEDEDPEDRHRHWCATCRDEIRYERQAPGKVFRIKVYASNGLMKAGAWEACWKEMERVDVELEPIVDSSVQGELERLAALELELEEQRRQALELERMPELEADHKPELLQDRDPRAPSRLRSELGRVDSPTPSGMQLSLHASSQQRSSSLARSARSETSARCPIDTSEERRRRDEERMREIYGDEPPASSPSPTPAPMRDPTPAPVEPQPAQEQQTQLYQPQQLTAPAAPPMHVGMPMLTDGSNLHQRHPDPYNNHANPYPQPSDPYHHQPAPAADQKRRFTLDENSGFVELLMEAFKVLLRDPKNVAIIVLCVFVVVMMKNPAMRSEAQNQLVHVPAPAPPEPYVAHQPEVTTGQGRVTMQIGSEAKVDDVVGIEPKVDAAAGEVVARATVNQPVEPVVVPAAEVAVPGLPETVEAAEDVPVVDVPSVAVESLPAIEAVEVETIDLGEICLPRGLEYPMTMSDEVPLPAEEEDAQVAVEESEVDVPAPSAQENTAAEECTEDHAELDTEDTAGRCQMDADFDSEVDAELSPSVSSSSVFVPGPLVTERKTVRVFETVTETVRVSVVTETETVSTVVTAIPQTVEETVFETETVRITVSVPVEEQKNKVKGAKGYIGPEGDKAKDDRRGTGTNTVTDNEKIQGRETFQDTSIRAGDVLAQGRL